jgi:hypothetical protein
MTRRAWPDADRTSRSPQATRADESGTTVTADYTAHGSRFRGKIKWVQIDLGKGDHDHFIDPEERLRIAMARQ